MGGIDHLTMLMRYEAEDHYHDVAAGGGEKGS